MLKVLARRYDLVIDQQAGAGSANIAMLSAAKYRLGWHYARGRYCYNLKAIPGSPRYHGSRNFDMLLPLGIQEQPFKLHVYIEQKSLDYISSWLESQNIQPYKFICIAPGSPVKRKQWDIQCFQKLIMLIAEKTDYKVVLTYAPGEEAIARRLSASSNNAAIMGPPTTYNQVAALLSLCRLLVCNDGGINHLSVATGTPAIALFSHASTIAWSPQGVIPHHYHMQKSFEEGDPTFGISPEEVFNKIQMVLGEL